MDILISVALPVSLVIIMLSLGVGLSFADFARVKAFAIGAVAQVLLLALIAYVTVSVFALPGELAVGIMLLSFAPGGVTSNMLCKLSKGDVALSVSPNNCARCANRQSLFQGCPDHGDPCRAELSWGSADPVGKAA